MVAEAAAQRAAITAQRVAGGRRRVRGLGKGLGRLARGRGREPEPEPEVPAAAAADGCVYRYSDMRAIIM